MYDIKHEENLEHHGHDVEVIEDVYDNYIEHTVWARCNDCDVKFRRESVTLEELPNSDRGYDE